MQTEIVFFQNGGILAGREPFLFESSLLFFEILKCSQQSTNSMKHKPLQYFGYPAVLSAHSWEARGCVCSLT